MDANFTNFEELLLPVPRNAVWSDPDYFIWCGTLLADSDGIFHLFYSRWRRELGFDAWVTHSEIAHAVSNGPLGPFQHRDVALPSRGAQYWDGLCTHNPTIGYFEGKYTLYYMGNTGDGVAMKGLNWTHRNNQRIGVAVADHPDGPWTRFDEPLIAPTAGFLDALCCANPSVAERPEGGYLMVYKGVADSNPLPFGGPVTHIVATADCPTGPFKKHLTPVFTKADVPFAAEDPFIWFQDGEYWAIVKDMSRYFTSAGRSLALFHATDGFDWQLAPYPLVSRTQIYWDDGQLQEVQALERPQLWLQNGTPKIMLCAVTPNNSNETSFNVQIPLLGRAVE